MPRARSWEDIGASVLFEKVLTSSDINPQGRIVVPKVSGPPIAASYSPSPPISTAQPSSAKRKDALSTEASVAKKLIAAVTTLCCAGAC